MYIGHCCGGQGDGQWPLTWILGNASPLCLELRKYYCDAWSKVEDDHRKEEPQHCHIKRTFVLLRNPKNKNQHHGEPWGIWIHASRYLLPHLEVPRGAAVELLGGLKQIFLVEDPFNFERRCISILWILDSRSLVCLINRDWSDYFTACCQKGNTKGRQKIRERLISTTT